MTSGVGTKSIPKDYRFENILRMNLTADKFDKIIYYDTCIILKPNKVYGKIIISDDCIYSYIEISKTFSVLADFKDIVKIELLNDIPQFIVGPMRNDCIHVKILYKIKSKEVKIQIKDKSTNNMALCCNHCTKELDTSNQLLLATENLSEEMTSNTQDNNYHDNAININEGPMDSIDFYILNKFSPVMTLLKKSYVDYLIRETLQYSPIYNLPSSHLTQSLINNLFDGLIIDISKSIKSIGTSRDFLVELMQSGYKYTRIRILFWSKSNLFESLVEQSTEELKVLMSLDQLGNCSESVSNTPTKQLIVSSLNSINLFLKIFNIFFFETDHLHSKWEQLRKKNGKFSLLLTENLMILVAYLNRHDRYDEISHEKSSEFDVDIDYVKHEITVNSIQLFYNLICSAQVTFNNAAEINTFTTRNISNLIESLTSYDDNQAVFNSFINQIMHMVFVWLFPKVYKLTNQTELSPQQVVSMFQLFTSLKILVNCLPKIIDIFRREMKEEFHYFVLQEITFCGTYPLSKPTVELLKTFQKNMTNLNQIFVN